MEQPNLSESEQTPASDMESQKLVRETQKLDLEIEGLRKKNRRDVIRLITTMVTVAALLFGLYKFYVEQQKERFSREAEQKLRLQNQMRADIGELLGFTKDKDQTISRALFLLEDFKALLALAQLNDEQRTFDSHRETFTKSLVYLVLYDSDFEKGPREVRLAAMLVEACDDCKSYLMAHLDELNQILYKHVRAMRYLRDKNPGYLEDMKYYEPTNQYFVLAKYEKQDGEERRFQHFIHIRNGFRAFIKLIAEDPRPDAGKIRSQNLRDFEAALCNPEVAKQVLGNYFANEPCER